MTTIKTELFERFVDKFGFKKIQDTITILKYIRKQGLTDEDLIKMTEIKGAELTQERQKAIEIARKYQEEISSSKQEKVFTTTMSTATSDPLLNKLKG